MKTGIALRMQSFKDSYGKIIAVGNINWTYYRIGTGPVLFWLTGGIRRAAFGFAFMQNLADRYTIIAPDYPPTNSFLDFREGFRGILEREGVERYSLGGQSYGGILAQAFLASETARVDRLVLSSSGPGNYGLAWLPVEYVIIGLVHLLPEKKVTGLLAAGLSKVITVPEEEKAEWSSLLDKTFEYELGRKAVVSHFAVAADIIRRRITTPKAYEKWPGKVIVLGSENDPTQSPHDLAKYERLFGKPVRMLSTGKMGHTAAMFDSVAYSKILAQAIGEE